MLAANRDEKRTFFHQKYIDVESVYTPKDMQTMANKNKKSIKVKLGLPEDCDLKPGEEVKVGLK